MNAINGGWVGQTLAVARCNDSGGRKSRIRRSKEERKATAESFIKKYQKLNNGNFPSLNLTHKEVGGSFYTVREIVREIIQENRLLGPAKFSTDEKNSDEFLKQLPLGAISIEPQTQFSASSDGTCFSLVGQKGISEELGIDTNGQFTEPDGHKMVDNGQIINGKQPSEETELHDELMTLQVSETSVAGENVEDMEASAGKVTHTMTGKVSSDENHQQATSEEMIISSNGQLTGSEHQRFDSGRISDGFQAGEKNGNATNLMTLHVIESSEAEKNVKEVEASAAEVSKTTADVTLDFTEPQQGSNEDLLLNSNKQFTKPVRQMFDNGAAIDGNHASDVALQVSEACKAGKVVKGIEGSMAKVTNITEGVIVETFPVRSAIKQTENLGKRSGEVSEVAGSLEDNKTKDIRMKFDNDSSILGKYENSSPVLNIKSPAGHSSALVDAKVATALGGPVADMKPGLVEEKGELNYGSANTESLNGSTIKGVLNDINGGKDLKPSPFNDNSSSEALDKSQTISENTPIIAQNGGETLTFSTSTTASTSRENSKPGVIATENKAEDCGSGDKSQKEINPTMDRINLESWESKRSTGQENNPLVTFVKALIAAFVKFWSE